MIEAKKSIPICKGTKRGRKEKFSQELCNQIVTRFFQRPFVHGQASYEDIAEFGRKMIGNDELQARHFSRKKNIKERIDKINESIFTGIQQGDIAYIEFNPDRLIDVYHNDKETLMVILRRFADDYRSISKKFLNLQGAEVEYVRQIDEFKKKCDKLNEKYKEQKDIAEKRNAEVKRLSKFKQLDDEFKMRMYLNSKVSVGILNEENVQIIINAIGFTGNREDVKVNNKNLENEECNKQLYNPVIKGSYDNIGDNCEERKIINFRAVNVEKDDDIEKMIEEINSMIDK